MRVRPNAVSTGFASWDDDLELDRWRTGDVFGNEELPVLFAHGRHNQPDAIVLATTEYRQAYAGRLSRVLARMVDAWHLVWVGFSFADQRINGVLREVAEHTGTRANPGGSQRHIAVMAWDPSRGDDPQRCGHWQRSSTARTWFSIRRLEETIRHCSVCWAISSSRSIRRYLPRRCVQPQVLPRIAPRVRRPLLCLSVGLPRQLRRQPCRCGGSRR
jgi:hypothetical protein